MTSLVTAFAYNQVISSVYPELSDYETSNRWTYAMLQNKISLYKNSTQNVLLEVRSLSNKLLKVLDRDFYLNIIDPRANQLVFRRMGCIVDENKGRLSFPIATSDTDDLLPGAYIFSVSAIDTNGNEVFMFLDQDGGATGDLLLQDKALPGFVPSFQVTNFGDQLYNETTFLVSSALPGDGQFKNTEGLHTVAVYLTGWTGKFYIEGSLMADPGQFDWFDIIINEQYCYQLYTDFTGIDAFNFYSPVNWVRFKYYNDPMNTGTFDQIYYRGVNPPNPNYFVATTLDTASNSN